MMHKFVLKSRFLDSSYDVFFGRGCKSLKDFLLNHLSTFFFSNWLPDEDLVLKPWSWIWPCFDQNLFFVCLFQHRNNDQHGGVLHTVSILLVATDWLWSAEDNLNGNQMSPHRVTHLIENEIIDWQFNIKNFFFNFNPMSSFCCLNKYYSHMICDISLHKRL